MCYSSESAVQANRQIEVYFETVHDPFAELSDLFFVELKVFAKLDLPKLKALAKLCKEKLPQLFRVPSIYMELHESYAKVNFASFSPRNSIMAMTVLIFLVEHSNFETKEIKYQLRVAAFILNFVGSAEVKPNVKIRRRWSKAMLKAKADSKVKSFAASYGFSM